VQLGQFGIGTDEIMDAGTFGHHWKEYSIREIEHYFRKLSADFTLTHWTTWGSNPDEAAVSLKTLVGDTEPSPAAVSDPVVGLLKQMVRAGHPVLGTTLFVEVTLTGKGAGIVIRPPWET
jgi:hypothetical protein